MSKGEPLATPQRPSAIYVWLVPSEEVLDQPGSWRIRKWDTEPFPEATYVLSETAFAPLDDQSDEPLRELCYNYRNSGTSEAETHFQRVVRWVKNAAPQGCAPTSKRGSEVDASDSYAPVGAAPSSVVSAGGAKIGETPRTDNNVTRGKVITPKGMTVGGANDEWVPADWVRRMELERDYFKAAYEKVWADRTQSSGAVATDTPQRLAKKALGNTLFGGPSVPPAGPLYGPQAGDKEWRESMPSAAPAEGVATQAASIIKAQEQRIHELERDLEAAISGAGKMMQRFAESATGLIPKLLHDVKYELQRLNMGAPVSRGHIDALIERLTAALPATDSRRDGHG